MSKHNTVHICMMSSLHSPYDDRIYWKQALSLKKAGYQVTHICLGEKELDELSEHGIRLVQIRKKSYSKHLLLDALARKIAPANEYSRILQKAAGLKADIYHMHDLQLLKIAPAIKALPYNPLLIYDVHEPNPVTLADAEVNNPLMKVFMKTYAGYIHYWELRKAKYSDLVIATEENVAQNFKDHLAHIPVEIIYNYCNWTVPTINEMPDKRFDFIYSGGIRRRRGAMEMLHAMVILREQGIKARLLMIGLVCDPGLKEEMEKFIESKSLSKQVTLHLPVPYEKVTDFYKASRCGLAFFDTKKVNHIIMPIKIFEYIAFGLPVITTGIGHMKKITETYHTGLTVEPGNIAELAEAMKKLMTQEKLYNTLRQNCLNLYRTQFNWQQMEKKLTLIYKGLLENRTQEKQAE